MSDEMDKFLAETWGDEQEWHKVTAKTVGRNIIGRLSALIFYGKELRDNEEWLDVTDEYAYMGFMAARELRLWPQALRPFVQWLLPCCRRLRALARKTRGLVRPVLTARRKEKAWCEAQGKDLPEYHDAIEFMERAAKGRPYDAAMGPVLFSVNALHTTTDLLTQVLLDLSDQPALINALRQEVLTVMPHRNGWKSSTLENLKLLDSVIKESLRLKPSESILMRRYAMRDVALSDGSQIRKGTVLGISTFQMRDPEIYTKPDTYNGYRFFEMRKIPELEKKCPLVATSPAHLGFGHGIHACPGRFLAAIQIKIVMCHIIMKYDIRPAGAAKAKVHVHGIDLISDPEAEILVRKREQNVAFV
ncbi:hypothetical protein BBP40_005187 [Aspergillus hancockii]|nr:hypothetical protein BBP40_005187 [Aspergillus hancockii]